MCLRKMRFIKVMMVLVLALQPSDQRPSLQGRYRRSKNDITIGNPLSEEEFQLSLHLDNQPTDENYGSPTNQGLNLSGLFEGDIAGLEHTSSGGNQAQNAVSSEDRLWKDGIVPYEMSDSFGKEERKIIARGIRNIQDKSCIQFVKRTTEKDYIQIVSTALGCFSEIGRIKERQVINLERGRCMTFETVTHELMHALGFQHEHNRPDRDNYININYDNLENGTASQFEKYDPKNYKYLADYDINSIMHYKSDAFARNKNVPSIRPKHPLKSSTFIGSTDGLLSPIDQIKLNNLYKCDLSLSINCPKEYLGEKKDENRCFKVPNFGCYCIVKKLQTRAEADQFCRDHKMQLVWLENKKESEEVSKLMIENGMEGYWTSGMDRDLDKQWRWEQLQSSASFPVTEFDWCAKSPDNFDGKEFYLLVRNHPGGKICWEDAPGDFEWPAICKPSLSAKMLLDNLKLYTKAISKLHSELTAAYSEMKDLKKTVLENLIERKENGTSVNKAD